MKKDSTKLQQLIDSYNTSIIPYPLKKSKTLSVGQVRILSHKDNPDFKKQIVIIGSVKETLETRTCEVILTHDLVELSTSRDFNHIPNHNSSSLSFGILSDFIGNMDVWQLANEVLGEICSECVLSLYEQSNRPNPKKYELAQDHTCLVRGQFEFRLLDATWNYRNREYLEFLEKSNQFEDKVLFLSNRKKDFYEESIQTAKLANQDPAVIIAKQFTSLEQILEFKNSWKSNGYRDLLRVGIREEEMSNA